MATHPFNVMHGGQLGLHDWSERLEKVNDKDRDEISVSGIDDVIMILKSDYENAYFGTGIYLLIEFYTDCLVAFLTSPLS